METYYVLHDNIHSTNSYYINNNYFDNNEYRDIEKVILSYPIHTISNTDTKILHLKFHIEPELI